MLSGLKRSLEMGPDLEILAEDCKLYRNTLNGRRRKMVM